MRMRARAIYVLAPLCCLVMLGQAQAQTGCVPVVYAFRHAEDDGQDYPYTLSATGQRHAELYYNMIYDINTSLGLIRQGDPPPRKDHCSVTKVYSINLKKADGSGNTTNPFYTAMPLAQVYMHADPLQTVGSGDASLALLEYLGNPDPSPARNTTSNPFTPSYTTDVAKALRAALVTTAKAGGSSAIFWTSQGLHVLGGAIINGESKVPQKKVDDGADPPKYVVFRAGTPIGTPPRNAVYIFPYNASKEGFDDVTKFNQHVQCYNWTISSPDSDTDFRADYWCGNSNYGDLGGNPKYPSKISVSDLSCVRAKIFNIDTLTDPGDAYYGFYPSGQPKVVPPCGQLE